MALDFSKLNNKLNWKTVVYTSVTVTNMTATNVKGTIYFKYSSDFIVIAGTVSCTTPASIGNDKPRFKINTKVPSDSPVVSRQFHVDNAGLGLNGFTANNIDNVVLDIIDGYIYLQSPWHMSPPKASTPVNYVLYEGIYEIY